MDNTTGPALRVFVNGSRVDVMPGMTALDAVTAWDPAVAAQVRAGAKGITDSRGIRTTGDAAVFGGAIFRIVRGEREEEA